MKVLMMKNRNVTQKKEDGFAVIETLMFLMAFIVLTSVTIDFYTAIHTGIVNSIAARTYLFETLQHRSDVAFLRDEDSTKGDGKVNYRGDHERFHMVADEDQPASDSSRTRAPGRKITAAKDGVSRSVNDGRLDSNNNKTEVIFIKTGYGMCVDSRCPGG